MISYIWLRDALINWAIIIAAVLIGIKFWYLIPVSIFIIGNRQHALALLGHESTHKLVSKNNKINYLLGNILCFAPLSFSWYGYRDFHMKHHKWLGTDKDPELKRKAATRITDENANNSYIIKTFIKDLLFLNTLDIFKFALPKRKQDKIFILLANAVVLSFALLNPLIPIMWYAAMCSSLLAISRLRIWYEHIGEEKTNKIKPSLWSRLLFLPHSAAYHHEHHEKPSIPYNKLPEIAESDRKYVKDIHK